MLTAKNVHTLLVSAVIIETKVYVRSKEVHTTKIKHLSFARPD